MEILLNSINISWIIPAVSQIFLFIDAIVYAILEGAIDIFFMVGSLNFGNVSADLEIIIKNINTLVGIFIMFKASLLLIQYLVEPDKFKDKNQGGENLIKSIVVTMSLLVLLEIGVLFGIFNDFQKIVFGNGSGEFEVLKDLGFENKPEKVDLIQKMVFGNNVLEDPSHIITVKIFEMFLYTYDKNGGDDIVPKSWFDSGGIVGTQKTLNKVATSKLGGLSFFALPVAIGTPLNFVNDIVSTGEGEQYTAILSTVFGIYMIITFFTYAVQIIIRFFKLLLLQMLSPIAIVSNITPDGKKTFKNFWSTYFSTYAELFIRLLVVYLGIYLISAVLTNDIDTSIGGNLIANMVLKILFLSAISKFMKEMPNIIAGLFGGKLADNQRSLGSLIGGALGFGATATVAGLVGKRSGLKGWGLVGQALMGGLSGAKAGANSQNMGSFVSGQISAITKSNAQAMDVAAAGGFLPYIQAQTDKTFGKANEIKIKYSEMQNAVDFHNKHAADLKAVEDSGRVGYAKQLGKKRGMKFDSVKEAAQFDANAKYASAHTLFNNGAGSVMQVEGEWVDAEAVAKVKAKANVEVEQFKSAKIAFSNGAEAVAKVNGEWIDIKNVAEEDRTKYEICDKAGIEVREKIAIENKGKIDATIDSARTYTHSEIIELQKQDEASLINRYEQEADISATEFINKYERYLKYIKNTEPDKIDKNHADYIDENVREINAELISALEKGKANVQDYNNKTGEAHKFINVDIKQDGIEAYDFKKQNKIATGEAAKATQKLTEFTKDQRNRNVLGGK